MSLCAAKQALCEAALEYSAIISPAALHNGPERVGKDIGSAQVAGAGAAAIACLDAMLRLGVKGQMMTTEAEPKARPLHAGLLRSQKAVQ